MRDPASRPESRARGFTLVELLIVVVIIGIMVGLILIAAQDGVRRAEEKATLSLITKLEVGLSERIDAILSRRADVFQGHLDLATIWNPNFPGGAIVNSSPGGSVQANQRSQVIAQFDLYRAEVPDVFFVQNANVSPTAGFYPINFAGLPYPLGGNNYNVPIGSTILPNPLYGTAVGVNGATYPMAAALYKNLGYLPAGYDGADNDNNGTVDDALEGIGSNPTVEDPDSNLPGAMISVQALVARRLALHKHATARSEMLYALLVEGVGPLGSVFNKDEFTRKEVADTDSDGMPEFIDAWGNPLQFYRWPIYYNSENTSGTSAVTSTAAYIQKGSDYYGGYGEPRQLDPIDPSQTLVDPAWFSSAVNTGQTAPFAGTAPPNGAGNGYSTGATMFMYYFHSIVEPNFGLASAGTDPISGAPIPPSAHYWDRSGAYARREYYSRPLILSAGPDGQFGVAQVGLDYSILYGGVSPGYMMPLNAVNLVAVENQAAPFDPVARTGGFFEHPVQSPVSALIQASGQDDVSNMGLASPGGGIR